MVLLRSGGSLLHFRSLMSQVQSMLAQCKILFFLLHTRERSNNWFKPFAALTGTG